MCYFVDESFLFGQAILYNSNRGAMNVTDGQESQQCTSNPLPSGLEVVGSIVPPRLTLPSEQYPSVLVTEAKSSNAVTVRYDTLIEL